MNTTYTSIRWRVEILPVNCSQPPSPLLFFNRNTVEFYSLVPRLFVISVRAAISGARPWHFIEFECTFQYVLPHVLNERRTLIKTCTRPIPLQRQEFYGAVTKSIINEHTYLVTCYIC